jgi:transcription initiation factor TFIIIB Brf1 subunit/transcription initiation factor TFIIB
MPFRCKRCDEKNLRCFVDTATGRCAGCISVHAECSLFVPEEEWEKVEQEEREKRLVLARAEEDVARAKRELLEIGNRKHDFARRDLAVLNVQDQAQASESSSTVANSSIVEPVADSGWSQANNLLDPSFDQYFNDLFSGDAFPDPSLSLLPGGESPIVTSGAS